ncbi:MAG: S8 family peptidase [Lachnospiraceae bacterium]|nr:S8 family peptidase [Lachnospiraceae bacterium]
MNNILQLKGQFNKKPYRGKIGSPRLPVGSKVSSEHMKALMSDLQNILNYWEDDITIQGALISVYYKDVVAKSNRVKGLLCKGSADPSDSICGSRFEGEKPYEKHVFTHYLQLDVLRESIKRLKICINIIDKDYKGIITWEDINSINDKTVDYKHDIELARTNFLKVIVDANYLEKFRIDRDENQVEERSIVTIFKTVIKTADLLSKLGINMIDAKAINETTFRLNPDELELLRNKAPYLIAMRVNDISKLTHEDIIEFDSEVIRIPSPENEPTIGVIDSLFYEKVYFKEWVEYQCMVPREIKTDTQDCYHGTAVSSIIVDGPSINPEWDDGCGRFKVKHFGVATKGPFSSFTILRAIREIVIKNRNIKVWNLSLGSALQIHRNFISPEAAELDRIQCEYDVIFVVAGTNKIKGSPNVMRLGAPADSLNSIVVNSVDSNGNAASYHRVGPVLSFFHKPDISYYGGDSNDKMKVCTPFGEGHVSGTSFAAPWISRKVAFLIHNMGFTREVAKALIVDSAANWNPMDDVSHSIGYGIVPRRIENIVQTVNDEIRFILTGTSDSYETYVYNIPIPVYDGKHPFFARATLCYFPKCVRDQGVDYTTTEMDIHFGRVMGSNNKTAIKSVNENKQGSEVALYLPEGNARRLYRKWDNIKHISDIIKTSSRPRKSYGGMWGISIKTKERLRTKHGKGLQFGVVITLKEMNGENRINDFIKLCMVRGWVVNQIDLQDKIDVYHKAEENIELE